MSSKFLFNAFNQLAFFIVGLCISYAAACAFAGNDFNAPPHIEEPKENKKQINVTNYARYVDSIFWPKQKEKTKEASLKAENIQLIGTFLGKERLALVQGEQGKKTVSSGESIGGWTVQDINSSSATFAREGKTLKIDIWDKNKNKTNVKLAQKESPKKESEIKQEKSTISKKLINEYMSSPKKFLEMAQFYPTDEGKVSGFKVSNIDKGSLLSKLGLEDDDVLARINGKSVNSPQKLLKMYSQLSKSSLVTVDILRQGQNKKLTVNIN